VRDLVRAVRGTESQLQKNSFFHSVLGESLRVMRGGYP